MSRPRLTAQVSPVLLFACAIHAQSRPADEATRLEEEIRVQREVLSGVRGADLDAVTVNGRLVPAEIVQREAVFLVGAKHVKAKIQEFLIEEQVKQAIRAGRDPSDFEISDATLQAEVETLVADFRRQNPDVDIWEALRAITGMTRERYLETRRQTILFDRVFFPGTPAEWPLLTREAINAKSGQDFFDSMVKTSVGKDGEPRALPPFWVQMCRGWVQEQLEAWSDVRFPADGLDPRHCLSVNERVWDTADAFAAVRDGLFEQDVERALTEVIVREALRQDLESSGAYLTDEEFRREFDEYRQQYDSGPFKTEIIAVNFKGYPSLEAFRQRWRLVRSYERMIADEIDDRALAAHADERRAFFGSGSVGVDLIQFMARDPRTSAWRPDGIEAARIRAERAMADLREGASFDDVLAARGEYYANDEERGRLEGKSLNQLRQHLRETEFTDLLSGGFSAGDFLFFEAEPGRIHGPIPGPEGWFIARVNRRAPAGGTVSVESERTRELVRQDYVNRRFRGWAAHVVAKAEIR